MIISPLCVFRYRLRGNYSYLGGSHSSDYSRKNRTGERSGLCQSLHYSLRGSNSRLNNRISLLPLGLLLFQVSFLLFQFLIFICCCLLGSSFSSFCFLCRDNTGLRQLLNAFYLFFSSFLVLFLLLFYFLHLLVVHSNHNRS